MDLFVRRNKEGVQRGELPVRQHAVYGRFAQEHASNRLQLA